MLVKINYEASAIKEYNASSQNAGHKYLSLIFTPAKMSLLTQATVGQRNSQFQLNFYPTRDNDGSINVDFEKALIEAFNNKELDAQPTYVDHVEVPIPPTLMRYQNNSKNHSAGDFIMFGDQPRVYESLRLVCLMQLKDGKEIPQTSMNELMSRALNVREYRIEQGQWEDANNYAETNDEAENANVIHNEPEPVQPQRIQRPQRK